jgi:hypothetical protein
MEAADHLGSCKTLLFVNTGVWIVETIFAGRVFAKLAGCGGSATSPHGEIWYWWVGVVGVGVGVVVCGVSVVEVVVVAVFCATVSSGCLSE